MKREGKGRREYKEKNYHSDTGTVARLCPLSSNPPIVPEVLFLLDHQVRLRLGIIDKSVCPLIAEMILLKTCQSTDKMVVSCLEH